MITSEDLQALPYTSIQHIRSLPVHAARLFCQCLPTYISELEVRHAARQTTEMGSAA